jgi:hypothetical protein
MCYTNNKKKVVQKTSMIFEFKRNYFYFLKIIYSFTFSQEKEQKKSSKDKKSKIEN